MKDRFETRPADIVAALGPAIGPCCYEVDDAVLVPFRRSIPRPERFITVRNHSSARSRNRIDLAATTVSNSPQRCSRRKHSISGTLHVLQ